MFSGKEFVSQISETQTLNTKNHEKIHSNFIVYRDPVNITHIVFRMLKHDHDTIQSFECKSLY